MNIENLGRTIKVIWEVFGKGVSILNQRGARDIPKRERQFLTKEGEIVVLTFY